VTQFLRISKDMVTSSVPAGKSSGTTLLHLVFLQNIGEDRTFARSCHPVKFSYMLGGTVLDRVSSINDLGVIMNEKMTFSEHEHVDAMVAKAFAMLGFIRRLSLEFRDPYTLKSLYTSLARPKLEYASYVWNP
jgi:hypothetical protein